MTMTVDGVSKVTVSHLERDAYVYVRQSTLTQVREHTESLERQYELASRAQVLGWAPRQVTIVEDNLGRSGAESSLREGFKNLVADVGLGKVGIILGIEVSRLARNNADWYQLLDLCAVTDTLIAQTGLRLGQVARRTVVARCRRADHRAAHDFRYAPGARGERLLAVVLHRVRVRSGDRERAPRS